MVLKIAAAATSVLISGCAGNMSFERSNMFVSESFELRRDGSFEYDRRTDEFDNCTAQGLWKKTERIGGVDYIAFDVRSYTTGGPKNCGGVTLYGNWNISREGIAQGNGGAIPWKRRSIR